MSIRILICGLSCAVSLGAAVPSAAAQDRGSMIPPETLEVSLERSARMFERLDTDTNGFVTRTEVAAAVRRAEAQMAQGQGGPGTLMTLRGVGDADTDNSGSVTPEEMRIFATARFQAQDRNGDGVLSNNERPGVISIPGAMGVPRQDQTPPMGDPSGG